MHARRIGEHALLVECGDPAAVPGVYATLRESQAVLGAVDLVPAAVTVLVDGVPDVEAALAHVAGLAVGPASAAHPQADPVEIPVTYDGPDLAEVARHWRVDPDEVVTLHQAAEYVVAFCGFAPGFAYCTGLPDGLAVPRRAEPRSRVPAGSVALAGPYTSVYPASSPGGWQLIGTTTVPVWRPDADQPALLEPGTRVRFRDASAPGSSAGGVADG